MRKIAKNIVDGRIPIIVIFILLCIASVFTSKFVKINNDLYSFLPEETETRLAVKAMDGEFTTLGTAKIMLRDVSAADAQAAAEKLLSVEGVSSVEFDDSEAHYKDGHALLSVTFTTAEKDERCENALNEVRAQLEDFDAYYDTTVGLNFTVTLVERMKLIGTVVVAIVIVLLTLTSRSFMEVPVLLITFGAAALLQFGSNFVFREISYVSNAVTLVLQLALAIDYAIILCNRFAEEKLRHEPYEALIEALSKAIPEIASSSLTTVGGLIAMTFMQFNLGADLGKVLMKSIVFSMLSVFLFMPGLLLIFNRAIDKTAHRSFVPRISGVGLYAWETKSFVPPLFVIVIIAAGWFSFHCPFLYNYYDAMPIEKEPRHIAHEMINETFGFSNMLAVVVPSGDYDAEAAVCAEIKELPDVLSVSGIASADIGNGIRLVDDIGISEFIEIAELDRMTAEALFAYYGAENGDYEQIRKENLPDYRIKVLDLFMFLHDVVQSGDEDITLSPENEQMIIDLYAQLTTAKKQLQGPNYSRMLVYCSAPVESEESYALIDSIHGIAEQYYTGDVFVAGDATCARDLESTYTRDNLMVSVVSAVLVVLIILLTFRNVALPILLILIIQGSIWINFSVPYFTGKPLFFVGYLIVSAIQMGANIDYAIVVSNRYISLRASNSKRNSIIEALNGALPTLLTSGSILAIAGLLIGNMTAEATVSAIGIALGRGTLISLFLVLFVLPQMLLLGDGLIRKTRFGGKKPQKQHKQVFRNDFEDVARKKAQRTSAKTNTAAKNKKKTTKGKK